MDDNLYQFKLLCTFLFSKKFEFLDSDNSSFSLKMEK